MRPTKIHPQPNRGVLKLSQTTEECFLPQLESLDSSIYPGVLLAERNRHKLWIDRMGAMLASLCALHCFLFMLGSVVLGFTATSLFFNPGLRWIMVFLTACLALGSLLTQNRNHHQTLSNWLMVIGLTAIIAANLWGIWSLFGEILCIVGGLILIAAHWGQLRKAKNLGTPEFYKGKSLPRKITVFLFLVALGMTLFQWPSVSRIFSFAGGSTADMETDKDAIGWGLLTQLDIYSGEIGPDLQKVVGKTVKIPGFVVPLDEVGKKFLLAPYAGACIHGPPPPINQIIYVKMAAQANPIDPWTWESIWVTGTLKVLEIDSPFGSAGFKMDGVSTKTYR